MIRHLIVGMALLGAGNQIALAQPAADGASKAVNPANTNHRAQTPEEKAVAQQQMEDAMRQGQEAFQKNFADMAKMTPEQLKEQMRKMQEQGLRLVFNRAGFKDPKLQDRILAFIDDQEKTRTKVRKAANKVYLALEPQGIPTNKQGMTILMVDYLNAVDDAKEEREALTQALDKEIDFTSNPHLMALLTLQGIIGEASYFTSDIAMQGSMTIGSLAGY